MERPGVDLAPKPSLGADRADRIDLLPLAGGLDHRRLPFESVGPAQIGFGAKARLVQKEDRGPVLAGPPPQARVVPRQPLLDRLRIAFVGPPQRPLRGNLQTGQQAPHGRELQADAKLFLDELRDDPPRPQTKVEAMLARILAENPPAHLLALPGVELGPRPAGLVQ